MWRDELLVLAARLTSTVLVGVWTIAVLEGSKFASSFEFYMLQTRNGKLVASVAQDRGPKSHRPLRASLHRGYQLMPASKTYPSSYLFPFRTKP